MKQIAVIFFLMFAGVYSYGQKNIDYIKDQTQDLQNVLAKHGNHLKLTEGQKADLVSIFDNKYRRVEMVLQKYTEKSEVSREMTKVENEFMSLVGNVLSVDQRLALKSQPAKKKGQVSDK